MTKPDIQIVLTTNHPADRYPSNSVEVRADGMVLSSTYSCETIAEAYEEAIRHLAELVLAYRQQLM